MKRLGDGRSSSQPKPPSGSSRVDSCNGGRGGSDLGCTLREQRKNYALTYLKEVKETLQDQREKYDKFLKVMKDFMDQSEGLFKGHNNLISGFNFFLPKGSEIALDNDEAHPQELFNEAWSFVTKIKVCFQNDASVYREFLDILIEFRRAHGHKFPFFDGHADLIDEFTIFLPPNAEPVSAKKWFGETFQSQREKYGRFLKVIKDFKAKRIGNVDVTIRVKELFEGHNNLISRFNIFLPKKYEIALEDDEAGPQTKKV
ncbi:paired amphipathic helix protein Sin3-like 1 [Quercus suber]|uniref:paired amphipathic helix protein Sin3-like 1 n=1 Tax=Quercus suber TaxID=58331 RepID=UPI0032DF0B7A